MIVVCWVLRILAHTEALDHYREKWERCPRISALLGVEQSGPPGERAALRQRVLQCLDSVGTGPDESDGPLQANLALIEHALGLSAIERELLEMRCQFWTQPTLFELFQFVLGDNWSDAMLVRMVAVAFAVSERQAWWLLDPERPLFRSGLMKLGTSVNAHILSKLEIQQGLSNALQRPARDLQELLRFAVHPVPPATLERGDFPHLAGEFDMLTSYLRAASRDRLRGANVLLYGPPGVGKTELSRMVASHAGLHAFQIAAEPVAGEQSDSLERLRQYQLTQALLGTVRDTVVILDDIDHVFRAEASSEQRPIGCKAWINDLLETNRLPAFWIANELRRVDPAYVRRFDLVLEIKAPPCSVRQKILEASLDALPVCKDWLAHQAEDSFISPAVTARLGRVLRTLEHANADRMQSTYERLACEHRRAIGLHAPRPARQAIADYRLDWLNVDVDVPKLIELQRRRPHGRVLIHGPPGTGKTAFAHYLARSVDRPLIARRASDLISMWVGQTEKNLRGMFEEAMVDDAVLLLDESDSFLQDRRLAMRPWEVTQVNELLTQSDDFTGLFICATNFLERVDAAALRRFGLKIEFRPLRAEQAAALFAACFRRIAGRELTLEESATVDMMLARLEGLTPGDFEAVSEHWAMVGETPSPADLAQALRQECALKTGKACQAIGF